jgi:hypothetical protein
MAAIDKVIMELKRLRPEQVDEVARIIHDLSQTGCGEVPTNWRKTSLMVAVSDTSPISNLSITGRLDLLRSQFSQVLIPEGVRTELERMPNPEGARSLECPMPP